MTRSIPSISTLLVFLLAGCDSNDEGPSDAERFIGTWIAERIVDGNGDQSAELQALVHSLTVAIEADGIDATEAVFLIMVDYKDEAEREDVTLGGIWFLDDGPRTLTLSIPDGASLPFTYAFESDARANLSSNAAFINPIFMPTTAYEGTVTITVRKQA